MTQDGGARDGETRFDSETMYRAAYAYYVQDANQASIAKKLGVSRPTISRMLAEARRRGMVEITVHRPSSQDDPAFRRAIAARLGVGAVHLAPAHSGTTLGPWLAPFLAEALSRNGLGEGDTLLVSSGLTLYQCFQEDMGSAPGVTIAPTVGGLEEPEPWYQTNALVTMLAQRIGGTPSYLYAPALPSPQLFDSLRGDPSFQRILHAWASASCVLLGVGAPPNQRVAVPSFIPKGSGEIAGAVGDLCSRYFDLEGREVPFAGSDRLVAITFDDLRRIPSRIAAAVGLEKVPSIIGAARGRLFTELITDLPTASAILAF